MVCRKLWHIMGSYIYNNKKLTRQFELYMKSFNSQPQGVYFNLIQVYMQIIICRS